jgi:hypothetical protein
MTKASNLIETAGFVPNYKIGSETKKAPFTQLGK